MFENYKLAFPGTNMHLLTSAIITIEIIFLVYQLIFCLNRPTDKNRRRYLILLFLLIVYNITGGLFSDPRLPVPINLQYILEYGSVVLMSIYIPYYIYKFLDLPKLKFYAYYGSLYFLLIPFIVAFVLPYAITGNIDLCRNLIIIIPFFYSISFLFALVKSILKKINNRRIPNYKEKIIGVFLAVFFWIMGLSVITYIKGGQIMEHSITNAGFLIMTVIFIRSSIINSRLEYQRFLKSEYELQKANRLLQIKEKRTRELEAAISNSALKQLTDQDNPSKKELSMKNDNYDKNCKKYHITEREKEIIDLISCGLTYKEISLQLNLSEKTLIKHRSNIFKKVNVNKKRDLLNLLFNSNQLFKFELSNL
jgi:DNA-binding CsgD family transcriptional regulator